MKKCVGFYLKYLAIAVCMMSLISGCGFDASSAVEKVKEVFPVKKEAAEQAQETQPPQQQVQELDTSLQGYYYQQLQENEKIVYTQLYEGIQDFSEKIRLNCTSQDTVEKSFQAMRMDHAQLYWVHNANTFYMEIYQDYTEFKPSYGFTKEEVQSFEPYFEDAYNQVLGMLGDSPSEYDRVKAVYEYVVKNTEYVLSDHDQNMAGVFVDHQAVCAGYSNAVQYLLNRLGVNSIYVTGDTSKSAEGHAWNIVSIDGAYYYVDATNGDQEDFLKTASGEDFSEGEDQMFYDYLCPFPEDYQQICWPDDLFTVPECTATDYNFYVLNGNCFDTYDWPTIYQYCKDQIDSQVSVVRFKFTNKEAYQIAKEELVDQEALKKVIEYYINEKGIQQMQYQYGTVDELETVYLLLS